MTAPVLDDNPEASVPDGAVPITLPVMVIEGMETSDRRYIEPGTIEVRDLPIPLYAATRSTHGAEGDAATWHVGAITHAERIPGPEAKLYGGKTLPEGTFAWRGRGWMYKDVPAAPAKSAYQLVLDGALRGNSVDMSEVIAEFQGASGELADEHSYERISMQRGVVGASTLVGIPAFAGAYIELEGVEHGQEDDVDPLVAGSPIIGGQAWLSSELGDLCHSCRVDEHFAVEGMNLFHSSTFVLAEDATATAEVDYSTSGMVALVPGNPQMLVAPGGDPAEQLHLTLAYLGDQVDEWEPNVAAAVHDVARRLTDLDYARELERQAEIARGDDPATADAVGSMSPSPAQSGPLTLNAFAHAVFNPNGGEHDPATAYLFDGTEQREAVDWLRSDIVHTVRAAVGDVTFPKQHEPFIPHVTAGWGLPVDQLTYTGPVDFTHIRVAIGDDVTDYPLGGGDGVLVASAADLPPLEWFQDPKLTEGTPITVSDDGRVFGHLAEWGTCHTGFADRCRLAPRSATGYRDFRVHACRARNTAGEGVTVPVGYASVSRPGTRAGHADIRAGMSLAEVTAHYDNTCTAAMELAVGEDEHGIWVAGRLMPGLDPATEYVARGAALSGDWRRRNGSMELVAALAVNTPGFPVTFKALVAGGEPQALVAAGVPNSTPKLTDGYAVALSVLTDELFRAVPTLEEVSWSADVRMALALDGDHPWLQGAEALAAKKLHLPPYIKRIAKHLREGGMSESHAIASAVNAAKKMCSTGDTSLPGVQKINAGSKVEACAAVAQWKADRPGSK